MTINKEASGAVNAGYPSRWMAFGLVWGAGVGFVLGMFLAPAYWFYLGPIVGATAGLIAGFMMKCAFILKSSNGTH